MRIKRATDLRHVLLREKQEHLPELIHPYEAGITGKIILIRIRRYLKIYLAISKPVVQTPL